MAASAPLLVFGGSGQVGARVLARCRALRQPVLALSRHAGRHVSDDGVRWIGARLPDAVPPLPPVAAVLSLGPLDLFVEWFTRWRPTAAVQVVALSSMSAVSKARSPHRGERELAERMRRAEDALARRCDDLGAPWTVLRPTLLWGTGMDRSLSRLARMAMRWRCMPLPQARGLRQPVHVDDVAAAVLASLHNADASGSCIECGGGERLAVHELFRRVRDSVPQRTVALPVPALLLRGVAPMARFSRAASAAARLNDDLLADNARLERVLGVHPRGFGPVPADWQPPPTGG